MKYQITIVMKNGKSYPLANPASPDEFDAMKALFDDRYLTSNPYEFTVHFGMTLVTARENVSHITADAIDDSR